MTGGTWPPWPPHQQQCGQQDKGRVGRQEGRQGERGWFGYRVIHMRKTNVEIKEREESVNAMLSLPSFLASIHSSSLSPRPRLSSPSWWVKSCSRRTRWTRRFARNVNCEIPVSSFVWCSRGMMMVAASKSMNYFETRMMKMAQKSRLMTKFASETN